MRVTRFACLIALSASTGCALVGFDLGGYGPADASGSGAGAGATASAGSGAGTSMSTSSSTSTGGCSTCCNNGIDDPGEVCFGSPFITSVASSSAVAIGDIDGDDKRDIVVTIPSLNNVDIFRNAGDGSIAGVHTLQCSNTIAGVALANLALPGKLDLLVGSQQTVFIYVNNSTPGSFSFTPTSVTSPVVGPQLPVGVRSATLTVDDVVSADAASADVSIFLNNGTPAFSLSENLKCTTLANATLAGVAAGNLDSDNLQDVAVLNKSEGQVCILQRIGTGFGASPITLAAPILPLAIAIADMDRDGKADIVVLDATGSVRILSNDGNLAFEQRSYPVQNPTAFTVADFDGDGLPDLAIVSSADAVVRIMLNRKGSFAPGPVLNGFSAPQAIAADDLNGDGKPDIVVADGTNLLIFVSTN